MPRRSSPHTWGCFSVWPNGSDSPDVFPTHVGVFLGMDCRASCNRSLPHTRGGVSICAWSTPASEGLPHTRGGVSPPAPHPDRRSGSSPHTWGCFPRPQSRPRIINVFPTHVGVFLSSCCSSSRLISLPHTRGGVSTTTTTTTGTAPSSPHTWGCFWQNPSQMLSATVFPTHVGVFLSAASSRASFMCLPHTRGGVSGRRGSKQAA